MYAVIQHGSHQYRVSAGDRLLVDRIRADVGDSVRLEEVLLLGGEGADGGTEPGKAVVTATVLAHRRGRKLRVMTYKAKKRHRRTLGYRSQLTELLVEEVQADRSAPSRRASEPAKAAKPRAERAAAAEPAPETAAEAPSAGAPAAETSAEAPSEASPPPKRARRTTRKATEPEPADGA
jgi:large subunit ribosomal protein L21